MYDLEIKQSIDPSNENPYCLHIKLTIDDKGFKERILHLSVSRRVFIHKIEFLFFDFGYRVSVWDNDTFYINENDKHVFVRQMELGTLFEGESLFFSNPKDYDLLHKEIRNALESFLSKELLIYNSLVDERNRLGS